MATADIDVRVNSQELVTFIGNLNEADRELRAVEGSARAVTDAANGLGSSSASVSASIGSLNTNVKTLVNLQFAETFNSLVGTFDQLGQQTSRLESYFREIAATTENPFIKSLAEAAAATSLFTTENAALAATLLTIPAAALTVTASIGPTIALFTSMGATITAAGAAISGFLAAAAPVAATATGVAVALGGVVTAAAAFVAIIIWGANQLRKAVVANDEYRAAIQANIEAVREQQAAATELNQAYVALTPQVQRLAELEEQVNDAREDSSQFMANVIADQAEVLGLYERQEEVAQRQLLLAEARNRFLLTEEAQLMINTMLQAGAEEADIARVVQLQSQERFNRLNTAELQEQLRLLPQIVEETTNLVLSAEAHGRVLTRVSELAGSIVGFFQGSPAAEETGIGRTIGGIRRDAEAANVALNQLADSNDAQMARLFSDGEGLQLTPEIAALYRAAGEEQRTFLLGLWEAQDDYLEAEAERRIEAAEAEALALEQSLAAQREHLEEQAAITRERMEREESVRAETLATFKEDIEERFELLHGYSLAYEEMTDLQIQNTARMSDDQAKALGGARTMFAEIGAASAVALAKAAGEGKSAADAMKAIIGQELVARGTSAIFSGAITAAGGNPMGLLEIAAGVAAVAAGSAMGGGGGGSKSPSVPASTTPGENQTTYTSVSFGFVGDRRAAGREVADVQENANRRGY